MPITREFLGWKKPCLWQAADWLLSHCQGEEFADLRSFVVVLPGKRAARRLLELLVEKAEQAKLGLLPPKIITQGALPELLYQPSLPFAGNLLRRSCWIDALRDIGTAGLSSLIPSIPEEGELKIYNALSGRLEDLWKELSGAGLSFADVAEHTDSCEIERWQVMEEIHRRYLDKLKEREVSDRYFERQQALIQGELLSDESIILISIVELPCITQQMLNCIQEQVTTLVFAPESHSDSFDELGCLRAGSWLKAEIPIEDEQLVFAERAAAQAVCVREALAELNGECSAEEVVIGIGDSELSPFVAQELNACGISTRILPGTELSRTSPVKLLRAVVHYTQEKRFPDFAALIRHPDLQQYLKTQSGKAALSDVDRYYSEHLPVYSEIEGRSGEEISSILQPLRDLLGDLLDEKKASCVSAGKIADFLARVYGEKDLSRFEPDQTLVLEACEVLRDMLSELSELETRGELAACLSDKLEILCSVISRVPAIPPAPGENAIDLLQWLELLMDDAPALIVCGMNEMAVPQSLNSDPFLPNSLRTRLGLMDNDKRFARDVFSLSAILNSRSHVRLVAGQRNQNGDGLMLSRLALRCSKEKMAKRVRDFYSETDKMFAKRGVPVKGAYTGEPPRPIKQEDPILSMSVTSFRDYIYCPYRFYLKHVLGLQVLDDSAREMDGAMFGELAHEVLCDFAESKLKHSSDQGAIYGFLCDALNKRSTRRFGSSSLAAVSVQLRLLQARCFEFAKWQVSWVGQGWRIERSELDFSDKPFLLHLEGGATMEVRGRIDRVDYNQRENTWAIFDYKTGDRGLEPESVHRNRAGEWFDFQLPVYSRIFCRLENLSELPFIGYLNLPKEEGMVGPRWAKWEEEDFTSAESKMRAIAQRVREQEFWPPSVVSSGYDDFSDICGQGVFRDSAEESDE